MDGNKRTESAVASLPYLQAVAREIFERTLAITVLEERRAKDASTTASLANHRREVRRAERELGALGWVRDPGRPLRFVFRGRRGEEVSSWQPESTAFYGRLELRVEG